MLAFINVGDEGNFLRYGTNSDVFWKKTDFLNEARPQYIFHQGEPLEDNLIKYNYDLIDSKTIIMRPQTSVLKRIIFFVMGKPLPSVLPSRSICFLLYKRRS